MYEVMVKTPFGVLPKNQARERVVTAGLPLDKENFCPLEVDVEVYSPTPDGKYLELVRRKGCRELWGKVKTVLEHYVPTWEDQFDYIGVSTGNSNEEKEIPDFVRMFCFVVAGASEGYYLHLEIIRKDGQDSNLFLGKTFLGAKPAWEVAAAISTILGLT